MHEESRSARRRRRRDERLKHAAPFREYAGVLVAFLVVIAFVVIGYAQMSANIFLGIDIDAPSDWMAAMLSLASAALGYLIGKNLEPPNFPPQMDTTYYPPAPPQPQADITLCPHCGKQLDVEPTLF